MPVPRHSTVHDSEFRDHVDEILDRAEANEAIIVERSSEPKVVIMSIERYERLTGAKEHPAREPEVPAWQKKLDEASEMLSRDLAGRQIDWNQFIEDMREDRTRQLLETLGYRGSPEE